MSRLSCIFLFICLVLYLVSGFGDSCIPDCPVSCDCGICVTSIEHRVGSDGRYFNFYASQLDSVLCQCLPRDSREMFYDVTLPNGDMVEVKVWLRGKDIDRLVTAQLDAPGDAYGRIEPYGDSAAGDHTPGTCLTFTDQSICDACTSMPTSSPSMFPTRNPSMSPTRNPSMSPTMSPTSSSDADDYDSDSEMSDESSMRLNTELNNKKIKNNRGVLYSSIIWITVIIIVIAAFVGRLYVNRKKIKNKNEKNITATMQNNIDVNIDANHEGNATKAEENTNTIVNKV